MTERATKSRARSDGGDTATQGSDSTNTPAVSQGSIVAARTAAGAVQARNQEAAAALGQWCLSKATTNDSDQFDVMANMVAEILAADNLADALTKKMPRHAREFLNRPFVLTGFDIREGEYEESQLPFYAALHATDPDTGANFIITSGGVKTLAVLMKMEFEIQRDDTDDEWPQVVMLQETKTSKGFGVIDLVRPA